MATCPECGYTLTPKSKKCPNCQTKIPTPPKDLTDKMPNVINTPEKITESENLYEKKLKIENIPLKVKPVKSPHHPSKTKKHSNKKTKWYSTIKIFVVTILLIMNIILITNIVINYNDSSSIPTIVNTQNKILLNTTIIGTWKTSNDGLFVFDDDYNFYWYDSYQTLDNNYYAGTYNYKNGKDALEEMGYTEEEFTTTFGENIQLENVYSMNINPTLSYQGGTDVTASVLNDNETWWFILIIKDDNTALGYNKTLDIRYNLTKY